MKTDIIKKIDNDNYFTIHEDGSISIIGRKAHSLYFAYMREARKIYKTLEEQEKITLHCILKMT